MNSLKEVYGALLQSEQQVKVAEDEEQVEQYVDGSLLKQAEDYDTVGRILAHQVFNDMVKQAMPVGHGAGSRHDDDEGGEVCSDWCEKFASEQSDYGHDVKSAILERMARNPEYVASLVQKHAHKF